MADGDVEMAPPGVLAAPAGDVEMAPPGAPGVAPAPGVHGASGPVSPQGPRTPKSPLPLSRTPEVALLQRACTVENVDKLMRMWLRDQLDLKVQVENPSPKAEDGKDAWIDGTEPLYLNVCDFLTKKYPPGQERDAFAAQLRELEAAVQRRTKARPDGCITTVPDVPVSEEDSGKRPIASVHGAHGVPGVQAEVRQSSFVFRGRLWQLGFGEEASVRGASVTYDILELISRHLLTAAGNRTEDYNLKLKFQKDARENDPIGDFSINFAQGFGCQLACFLIAHALIERSQWCPWSLEELVAAPGRVLVKVFRFSATATQTGSAMSEARQSLGEKMQASSRSRPNPVQIYRTVNRIYMEELAAGQIAPGGGVPGVVAAYKQIIASYNKLEKTKHNKINRDEEACVLVMARSSPAVLEKLTARASAAAGRGLTAMASAPWPQPPHPTHCHGLSIHCPRSSGARTRWRRPR